MGAAEQVLGKLLEGNNRRIGWVDPISRNPRRPADGAWQATLTDAYATIRGEWDTFVATGGHLPRIEDVLGEDQGNIGPWRVGVLREGERETRLARTRFAATTALLSGVPGLRAALWSVLEPGTELTEHTGPNAGVLRYHLGVDCPPNCALTVGEAEIPYRDGEGILFDDTASHAAWNHSDRARVTLFLEVERPLPTDAALANRAVQALLARDPRRRRIVSVADEWDFALNPDRSGAA